MRESAVEKGRRYVAEGRLVVECVDAAMVHARCRGGGAVYDVGFDAGSWFCSCPAVGLCSHLVALQLVTVAPAAAAASSSPLTSERAG